MKTTFRQIKYASQEWAEAVKLREKVLREPLGSRFTELELEEEKNHYHIAGYIDANLVATAVLVPEKRKMKIQRVAVLENRRGLHIGSEMMAYCEAFALTKNATKVYCHARDSAVDFYLKNKYEKIGEYFEEDGIPHVKMEKKL